MGERSERGLKQLPDGRWQFSWCFEGKYHRRIADTKTEARAYLQKIRTQIREGKYLEVQKEVKTTFEEAVKRFLEWSSLHMRVNGRQTDSWAARYWLASDHLRGKTLDKITGGDIERFRQELAQMPRTRKRGSLKHLADGRWRVSWSLHGTYHRHVLKSEAKAKALLEKALADIKEKDVLSKKALDEVIGRLKRLFNLCLEWGLCTKNPAAKIKLFREDDRRYRYLSEDEEERLLAACVPYMRRIVTFALHTGMRRGEILGLRWQDVDFRNRVAIIPASRSKSKKDRCIPLNGVAISVLNELPRPLAQEGLIFGNTAGGQQANIKRYWNKALVAAGIENFHFHDLRHTYASRLVTAGVDLAVLRELLGHADFTMTLRYAHLHPSRLQEAVAILESNLRLTCDGAKPQIGRKPEVLATS